MYKDGGSTAWRACGSAASAALDADHTAALDGERELAAFERQRGFAEQLAPPALQRGDLGLVVGGDLLEIVDGGDHLAGDAIALRSHPQQHLQQFDNGGAFGIVARLVEL